MSEMNDVTAEVRLLRSVLYLPASNERALEKAKSLSCDAIIFDLEDAVAPDAKDAARLALQSALRVGGFGARMKVVRINGLDTPWGVRDIASLEGVDLDAVLLPKVETPQMLDALADLRPDVPLWAMMETPRGMLNAAQIAAHPRLHGMVMGTNDLAKDLNARPRADRLPMMGGLHLALLAAKAHGLVILDGVYNAFKDEQGLAVECEQGRDMGFDGKTVIHPSQIQKANDIFSPSKAEIDLAARQIEAFELAQKNGEGIAVVDGKIVENLHIVLAQAVLQKAQMIKAME